VFFFKAYYESGPVELNKEELDDFAWVTKQEMREYVSPHYYRTVAKFLSS
jgi:large subunit ribosomal protein L46